MTDISEPHQQPAPSAVTRRGRASGLRTAAECLQRPKGRLAAVMAHGERLARLNRLLRALLPPHLQSHVRLKSLAPQAWTLQTESSAWATRLRYVLPALRQQMEAELKQPVPELKLQIEPRSEPVPGGPPRRLTLNETNADLIKSAADSVKDEQLGAALLRLAQRGGMRGDSK